MNSVSEVSSQLIRGELDTILSVNGICADDGIASMAGNLN